MSAFFCINLQTITQVKWHENETKTSLCSSCHGGDDLLNTHPEWTK